MLRTATSTAVWADGPAGTAARLACGAAEGVGRGNGLRKAVGGKNAAAVGEDSNPACAPLSLHQGQAFNWSRPIGAPGRGQRCCRSLAGAYAQVHPDRRLASYWQMDMHACRRWRLAAAQGGTRPEAPWLERPVANSATPAPCQLSAKSHALARPAPTWGEWSLSDCRPGRRPGGAELDRPPPRPHIQKLADPSCGIWGFAKATTLQGSMDGVSKQGAKTSVPHGTGGSQSTERSMQRMTDRASCRLTKMHWPPARRVQLSRSGCTLVDSLAGSCTRRDEESIDPVCHRGAARLRLRPAAGGMAREWLQAVSSARHAQRHRFLQQ